MKQQRVAGHREQPHRSGRARAARAQPRHESVPARRRPLRRHDRRADRGRQQGHAGRRAEVSRAVLRRVARRDGGVGQFKDAEVRAAAAELLGAWTAPAPYERIATTYQKTAPVNLKIETPDKQNATFDAGLALRDVRHRSRLPGDGAGQLHVRRVDHRARAEPDSQPGRAELRRELAVRGADRRERGELRRRGDQQPAEHAEGRGELPRRAGEDAGERLHGRRGRRREEGAARCSGSVGRSQDAGAARI